MSEGMGMVRVVFGPDLALTVPGKSVLTRPVQDPFRLVARLLDLGIWSLATLQDKEDP